MPKYIKLFSAAFSISFLGALPIGTLNASVANYTLNNNFNGAIQFGIAAILVEVVLVRLALIVLARLVRLKKLFKVLCSGACLGILMLAFTTLEAAFHMRNFQDVLPFIGKNAIVAGLTLSLLNPMHLPFWMGWTAVLKNKKILGDTPGEYNMYIIAIGAGTCLAFVIYGLIGGLLIDTLKAQHNFINWILGFTMLFTGSVLAYKLLTGRVYLEKKLNAGT